MVFADRSRGPRRAFRFDTGVSFSDTTIALCHPRCRHVGPVVDRGLRSRERETGRASRRDAGASGTRGSLAPALAIQDAALPLWAARRASISLRRFPTTGRRWGGEPENRAVFKLDTTLSQEWSRNSIRGPQCAFEMSMFMCPAVHKLTRN